MDATQLSSAWYHSALLLSLLFTISCHYTFTIGCTCFRAFAVRWTFIISDVHCFCSVFYSFPGVFLLFSFVSFFIRFFPTFLSSYFHFFVSFFLHYFSVQYLFLLLLFFVIFPSLFFPFIIFPFIIFLYTVFSLLPFLPSLSFSYIIFPLYCFFSLHSFHPSISYPFIIFPSIFSIFSTSLFFSVHLVFSFII